MKLVIVETPAQAKRLSETLGDGWRVEPCSGMVRDLPTDQLGINLEADFRPRFVVAPGKGNLVRRLMKALGDCDAVYAATPPTREGEALAWHVLALSPDMKDKFVYRVTLTALTPDAIRAAFAAPRPLDMKLIDAYAAERSFARLVGWSTNAAARPVLGFKTALTYDGMVALRLLADHDAQIAAFTPETRWRASVSFASDGIPFTAHVLNVKGTALAIRTAEQSGQLEALLKGGQFWVDKTGQTLKTQPAPTPLTLRGLIETAARDLNLMPEDTLGLVVTLYDAGWITHPDSVPPLLLSEAAKAYIRREFGTEYLAAEPNMTAGIAPADVNRTPEALPGDGAAVYALIWKYFIAAHMPPAQDKLMGARILVGAAKAKPYPLELRATAALLYFDGWKRVLPSDHQDAVLPILTEGAALQPASITVETVTNESPMLFSEGELMGALVDSGVSVSAAVAALTTLRTAVYVDGDGSLRLTETGRAVAAYLAANFGELTSPAFAREWAADVQRIASGERQRVEVLRGFWERFGGTLRPAPAVRAAAEHKPIVLRPAEEV
jgi:DNA topoisomerase-1